MGGIRQIKSGRKGSKEDIFMRNQVKAEGAKWGLPSGGRLEWSYESRYMRRTMERQAAREAKRLNRKNK